MAQPIHHGSQDVAPTQEALIEENELQAIEHNAIPKTDFPEPVSRTHFSHGRASSSRTSHDASSLANPTSREMMDSMARLHQRMDSPDTKFCEI